MSTEPERVVAEFCAAWKRRDIDELLGYLTEDAVYHNMPMAPVQGHDAIRAVFEFFVTPCEAIDWEVRHLAAVGNVVLTERVDRFTMNGKHIELPVSGVFELRGGKIAAWRDYFDMATWTRQTS